MKQLTEQIDIYEKQRDFIKKLVNETLSAKLKEYRKIIVAFSTGLGIFFLFLILNGLMSKQALIVKLHNSVFGIDYKKEFKEIISKEVALSYNNEFWLGRDSEERSHIFFYASKKQEVNAIINIKHVGKGELRDVSITIDKSPDHIFKGDGDLNFVVFPLKPHIKKASEYHFPTADKNVHYLVFSLGQDKNKNNENDDRILVQVLVNISGGGE